MFTLHYTPVPPLTPTTSFSVIMPDGTSTPETSVSVPLFFWFFGKDYVAFSNVMKFPERIFEVKDVPFILG